MMPHTERRGMITSFFSFKEKFRLDEVEKKIKAWADLKFFNDDTLTYLAFVRQSTDSLGCGIQRDSDPTLHQLYKVWDAKEQSDEISDALSHLPLDEQKAFYFHFGTLGGGQSQISKQEILVHVAAHIPSYPFEDEIIEEYEKFISSQNKEIKRLKKDIKKRLPEVLKRYDGLFWDLFEPGQIENYLTGSSGRCREKRDQIALTGLYFEGKIPLSVLKICLTKTKGGRKILNKL